MPRADQTCRADALVEQEKESIPGTIEITATKSRRCTKVLRNRVRPKYDNVTTGCGTNVTTVRATNVTTATNNVTPTATLAVESSARLMRLLNSAIGKRQAGDGSYPGGALPLTASEIDSHLRGEATIAFACLDDRGLALFGTLDIDSHFEELVPYVAEVTLAIGSEALLAGMWLTTGSGPGRGKAILSLEYAMDPEQLRGVLQTIKERVLATSGIPASIQVFPLQGSGGVVRVLGRNVKRNPCGEVDTVYAFGSSKSLEYVEPMPVLEACALARSLREYPQGAMWQRLAKIVNQDWSRDAQGGTDFAHKQICRLAEAAFCLYGPGGCEHYKKQLRSILSRSDALAGRSRKNNDPRNPLVREIAELRAWGYALDKTTRFLPQVVSSDTPELMKFGYQVLSEFVLRHGLSASLFVLDLERFTRLIGLHHKIQGSRLIRRLESASLVVVHDAGFPRKRGFPATPGMYGLVAASENLEGIMRRVRASAHLSDRLRKRKQLRAEYTASDVRVTVVL